MIYVAKVVRTQDRVHGSSFYLFLSKIARRRLKFACSNESKLVNNRILVDKENYFVLAA